MALAAPAIVDRPSVTGETLDAIAAVFDRLGPAATIDRCPHPSGCGKLWTIHTRYPTTLAIGQGTTLGEALRDIHGADPQRQDI